MRSGSTVAVVTDAGMPAISDPGARLVRTCLDAGLAVEVVPGPSAVLTALVVSGLATDRFAFEGFLPGKASARRARLGELAHEPRTTVIFESPHRLADTLGELLDVLGPARPLVLARELTKLHEEVVRGTIASALDHVRATPPRGEYVLVLGGAAPVEASDDEVAAAACAAVAAGGSAKDAAALVASELGVSRRRAYDAVVAARSNADEARGGDQ